MYQSNTAALFAGSRLIRVIPGYERSSLVASIDLHRHIPGFRLIGGPLTVSAEGAGVVCDGVSAREGIDEKNIYTVVEWSQVDGLRCPLPHAHINAPPHTKQNLPQAGRRRAGRGVLNLCMAVVVQL